ncbi:regulatory protein, gntR family [Peptoclostridium litorale DSM 5388]|uniref:GntR family transcriptional regulator n=1 Tax=Peptoclostridium litorale DSM 5388 TaxID=1121324 RepID=A0A069RFM2_PEPLI|nr:TrkA C-terminal domain-containing protein [Peptoclostridium litorale]KDR95816.1 GntR family transcriptional regulator [Peptoclostridium litorale DSM 5388]SIO20753.1 regulatory protein, gntR family [Peptoclostridium litorale DSM 5388]
MTTPKNNTPRYIKIAIDIAHRIYEGEFKVGDKLRGRSTLASEYNVSPETIRRAASLLQDMGVVNVSQKSGIFVISAERAHDFIGKFSEKNNIKKVRARLKSLRVQKEEIDKKIEESIDTLLEYTMQLKRIDLGCNYELSVPADSRLIGMTINELQFWHNTGATITAVKRDGEFFISPGPYFQFEKEDMIYFICIEDNLVRVKDFVNR